MTTPSPPLDLDMLEREARESSAFKYERVEMEPGDVLWLVAYLRALEAERDTLKRDTFRLSVELAQLRVAQLFATAERCERHPGWVLVWCNECIRVDRAARGPHA